MVIGENENHIAWFDALLDHCFDRRRDRFDGECMGDETE
jgi:hypothetical protein